MSLANISIVGNLAKEPEQYKFASGRVKTTLVVAVNSFNKVRKEKSTDFYRVETWDRLAELARSYLRKGNQVAVSGRLAMEKWVDRDGKDRVTPIVQANQLALPPRFRPEPPSQTNTVEAIEPMPPHFDEEPDETGIVSKDEESSLFEDESSRSIVDNPDQSQDATEFKKSA